MVNYLNISVSYPAISLQHPTHTFHCGDGGVKNRVEKRMERCEKCQIIHLDVAAQEVSATA
jgi:hypothetical protein